MLVMLLLAVVEQSVSLSSPSPKTFTGDWITPRDYPKEALKNKIIGVVSNAITVAPDGTIIACIIEKSSGSPLLDEATCNLMRRNGKFFAANNDSGQAAYGVDRGSVVWWQPGHIPTYSRSIQLAVGIQKMPKGLSDPAFAKVNVSVDASGRVDSCKVAPLANKNDPAPVDIVRATKLLGETACAQALKSMELKPAHNEQHEPVPSIQSATVAFTANQAVLKH